MKSVKRIFAVLFLIIIVAFIGYLSFTGSRMHDKKEQTDTEGSCYEEIILY